MAWCHGGEQAITWINFDQVLWGQIASLGLIELSMHKDNMSVAVCHFTRKFIVFINDLTLHMLNFSEKT